MKKLNKTGPSTDPWGIPLGTGLQAGIYRTEKQGFLLFHAVFLKYFCQNMWLLRRLVKTVIFVSKLDVIC